MSRAVVVHAGVVAVAVATVFAGAGPAAPGTSAAWRDGGRVAGAHQFLLMDSSTSHVVVAVGTTGPSFERPRATSTLARRMPDGRWTRTQAHIGDPVGVHVNARGNAVIISVRNDAVVATTWRRRSPRPRSRVVLTGDQAPAQFFTTTSVGNARGDVAVLLTAWPGYGDRAILLRKPARRAWRHSLTIGRARYGGALDSVDIGVKGVVVGAFKQDQTLSVRALPPRSNRFGASREVTTWAAIDDTGRFRESIAEVMVGPNGNLATTWEFAQLAGDGGSELVRSRLNIVPGRGRPLQRQFRYGDDRLQLLAVAGDRSVLVRDGLRLRRWNPVTRRLQGRGTWFIKDTNHHGDALIGSGLDGGRLRLWPVGAPRGTRVRAPVGTLATAVLTGDHRVYVAVTGKAPRPRAFYLRIRQF
jgi:hypothetical protein